MLLIILIYFLGVRLLHKKGKLCSTTKSYNPVIKACGQFVVFLYEGNVYPGEIISLDEGNIYISAMVKSLKSWK
jgi:hypothetical protein